MRCTNCGADVAQVFGDCRNCGTPHDQPAVSPGIATYSVRGIGLAAAIGLGLTMLLYVLQALSPAVAAVLVRRGATADDPELTAVTALAGGLLSLAHLAVYLTTGALVMIWMFRARKNTDAFPGAPSQLAAHWAITGWWVPVASLVVPFVVMARIVRDSLGRVRLRALVAVWWLAWLAFVVTDLLTSLAAAKADLLLADQAQDFDHYREAALRNSVPAAACLIAGVSLIVLVLRISAAQQDRITRATPAWPVPAGEPLPTEAPQPVTVSSPQVSAGGTVASPPAPGASGGTIGA